MSSLDAILAQYEKNERPSSGRKVTDLKDYFTTYLPDGQNSKTKTIRILPMADGSSPFVEVYGHSIQVDGAWRKFMCPKHQKNEPCPFCEARELLLASGKESDKELAKKYNARKMYIVKLIDREFEEEGPKFWRFNHDFRKTGVFDKIVDLLKSGVGEIMHPEVGRDLSVNISRDQLKKPFVSSIIHKDISPLSTNPELSKTFLSDERTWEDIYAVKSYDYLFIIVSGGIPFYDKDAKKYVDKKNIKEGNDLSDADYGSGLTITKESFATNNTSSSSSSSSNDSPDDLPF